MKNLRDAPQTGFRSGSLFLGFAVALALYMLSTGPVVELALEGKIPEKVVNVLYAPIEWVDSTKTGALILEPFFEWYGFGLWGWSFTTPVK